MIAGDQARKAATRFLMSRLPADRPSPAGRELHGLLAACADHLVDNLRLHPAEAAELSLACWADVSGRDTRCFVDLAISSPHLIWIVDPISETRRSIPIIDLVRILGPRVVASAATSG